MLTKSQIVNFKISVLLFLFCDIIILLIKIIQKGGLFMKKYVCDVCGYVYDPELGDPDNGIAPGTSFEDLPAEWLCPLCSVGKDQFSEQ